MASPPGAEAFKRDNPSAVAHFFDTGHFALETMPARLQKASRFPDVIMFINDIDSRRADPLADVC